MVSCGDFQLYSVTCADSILSETILGHFCGNIHLDDPNADIVAQGIGLKSHSSSHAKPPGSPIIELKHKFVTIS